MSERAAPARVRQTAAPQPGSKNELRLQRKCACGKHTADGSECHACKAKRASLQRWSTDRPSPAAMLRAAAHPGPAATPDEDVRRERNFLGVDNRDAAAAAPGGGELRWLTSTLADTVAGIEAPARPGRASPARGGRARLRDTYPAESRGPAAAAGAELRPRLPETEQASAEGVPGITAFPSADAASPGTAPVEAASPASATASSASSAAPAAATTVAAARPLARPAPTVESAEQREGVEERMEEESASAAPPLRALLFDDGVEDPQPGQMSRDDFLVRLRAEVTEAAEEELAGTGRTTDGCPYLRDWFAYYSRRGSRQIERALHRYAPEAARAERAADYIPLVVARVRRAVEAWARTGEITGVPTDLSAGAVLALLRDNATGPGHPIGPILYKAREGGARAAEDPEAVQAELGDGRPLDPGVRARMEGALGRELGPVHLHTDAGAGRLASGLNARAFAVGRHVAFAAGEYRPGTVAGDALIAHELAHVAQQAGGVARAAAAEPSGYGALERDADRAAAGAVASLWGAAKATAAGAGPALRSGLRLQRCSSKCPTKVEVAQLHPVPLTADHVRNNWRTGWGAVAEMKVSDAAGSNLDGASIQEHFTPASNTCGAVPNCTNASGMGGSGGATFVVGEALGAGNRASCGPPILVGSITLPAKRNTFYDCHLMGFGFSKLHQYSLPSCTQTCTQYYDCGGTRLDGTFTITRNLTRGVIDGDNVTNIAVGKG